MKANYYKLIKANNDTMPYTVEDKVILVTGANRGIGKAIVECFLECKAKKVYAAVRNIVSLNVALLDDDRVVPLVVDLSNPDTIRDAAKIATDVDIVVNNAGIISHTGPLDGDTTVQRLQEEMAVNVHGLVYMAQAFAPVLEQRNGCGILVQINSVASLRCAVPSVATYSASKAASFSMTQAIREALHPQGVHVVSVHPGPIATDMLATALQEFQNMAEPPKKVAEALMDALTNRDPECDKPNPPFLVYPDAKAKQLGEVYESFATRVLVERKSYG
jgi:NAD(P)-dependent dehydrogenase (short-subunit alcohol dehydrogenase family)